jgi:hypothetical protein
MMEASCSWEGFFKNHKPIMRGGTDRGVRVWFNVESGGNGGGRSGRGRDGRA